MCWSQFSFWVPKAVLTFTQFAPIRARQADTEESHREKSWGRFSFSHFTSQSVFHQYSLWSQVCFYILLEKKCVALGWRKFSLTLGGIQTIVSRLWDSKLGHCHINTGIVMSHSELLRDVNIVFGASGFVSARTCFRFSPVLTRNIVEQSNS